jgi:hypothetical protein
VARAAKALVAADDVALREIAVNAPHVAMVVEALLTLRGLQGACTVVPEAVAFVRRSRKWRELLALLARHVALEEFAATKHAREKKGCALMG